MSIHTFLNIFAWAAFLSGAAAILTFITGILFFKTKKYGKLNDTASIFQMLFALPLTIFLLQPFLPDLRLLSFLLAFIGAIGMLIAIFGQLLLVLGRIDFETSKRYFPAGAAVGVWLVGANFTSFYAMLLPPALAWVGMIAGLGYILTVIGFLRGGQGHPLFNFGAILLGVGYPVWAIWLGLLLLRG